MIKIILFKNNLVLISRLEEVPAVVPGEPDCKLTDPFELKGDFMESCQTSPCKKKSWCHQIVFLL